MLMEWKEKLKSKLQFIVHVFLDVCMLSSGELAMVSLCNGLQVSISDWLSELLFECV